MTWRELKERLDAMPASLLDRPVCYVEPYDDREIIEPDFMRATADLFDSDGRLCIGKDQPLLA